MASKDAEVRFGTKFDNKGMVIGLRDAAREVEGLAKYYADSTLAIRAQEKAVSDLKKRYGEAAENAKNVKPFNSEEFKGLVSESKKAYGAYIEEKRKLDALLKSVSDADAEVSAATNAALNAQAEAERNLTEETKARADAAWEAAEKYKAAFADIFQRTEEPIRAQEKIVAELEKNWLDASASADKYKESAQNAQSEAAIEAERLKNELKSAETHLSHLQNDAEGLKVSLQNAKESSVFDFHEQAKVAMHDIASMESKIQDLYAKLGETKEASAIVALKHEIAAAEQALESFRNGLSKAVTDIMAIKMIESEIKNIESSIERQTLKLEEAKVNLDEMRNIGLEGSDAFKEIEKYISQIAKSLKPANARVEELRSEITKIEQSAMKGSGSVHNLGNSMRQTDISARHMGTSIGMAASGFSSLRGFIDSLASSFFALGIEMDKSKVKAIAAWVAITLAISLLVTLAVKALEKVKEHIDKYRKMLESILESMAKIPAIIRKALSGVEKIISGFIQRTTKSIDGLIKKIINLGKSTATFNQLESALKDVLAIMSDAVISNKDFAASLNAIRVNLLSGFLAALEAVKPALLVFMQVLVRVSELVAKVLSMIFGTSFTNAKEYAKAIYNQSNAVKELGNSAKRALKFLAPFDEITRIPDKDIGDSGLGGIKDLWDFDFSGLPSTSWLDDLAEKLYSIVDLVDVKYWGNLGRSIGNWIEDQLAKIPWNTIRRNAKTLGQNFGAFLGGVFGNVEMWNGIGITISQGLNTALEFLNGVALSFPWSDVGKALASGLNSIVRVFDVELFTDTINKWAIGILDMLISAIGKTDWNTLGQKMADMLNGIQWVEILTKTGTVVKESLKGILTSLYTVFTDNQWAIDFAAGLANGLNQIFSDKELAIRVGRTLGAMVKTILSSINVFAEEFDWKEAGVFIGTGLKEMLDSVNPEDVADTINAIVDGVYEFLVEFFKIVPPQRIIEIAEAIAASIDFEKVVDVLGAFDALKEIPGKIFDMITSKINGEMLKDTILKMFPLSSVWAFIWSLFTDVGRNAISGLFAGMGEKMSGAFSWLKEYVFMPIWQSIEVVFSEVNTWFFEKFTAAREGIEESWNGITAFFTGVWEGVTDAFGNVTDWFKDTFSDAWQAVKDVFSTGGETFEGIKEGILETFKTIVNGIIDGINTVIKVPFDGINTALRKIKGISIAGLKPFDFINTISVPQIPRLAEGGIVDSTTIAMLGERGREAVLPLENNTGWMDILADKIAQRSGSNNETIVLLREILSIMMDSEAGDVYLDGRPVGKFIRDYISGRTNQAGKAVIKT